MLNKKRITLLSVFIFIVMFATCSSSSGAAKTYTLSLSTHDPATGPMTKFLEDWAKQVDEATGGQVKVTVYPGATLAASNGAAEAVLTGTIDIGWCFTVFFPNQFPLTQVTTLPMLGLTHPSQAAEVLWDLYDYSENLRAELSGYKVLMMLGNPSNKIFTARKPVYSVEDMKGLQMRALSGAPTYLLQQWGAIPVSMSPAESYEALSKRIIDGVIFEYSGTTTVNMQEYLNYYTEVDLYMGVFLLLMNKEQWNSMSPELQAKIDSVSLRGVSIEGAKIFYNDDRRSRQLIIEKGGNIIEPDESIIAGFKVAGDQYAINWVKAQSTGGFDAQVYYEKAVEFVKKHEGKYP